MVNSELHASPYLGAVTPYRMDKMETVQGTTAELGKGFFCYFTQLADIEVTIVRYSLQDKLTRWCDTGVAGALERVGVSN